MATTGSWWPMDLKMEKATHTHTHTHHVGTGSVSLKSQLHCFNYSINSFGPQLRLRGFRYLLLVSIPCSQGSLTRKLGGCLSKGLTLKKKRGFRLCSARQKQNRRKEDSVTGQTLACSCARSEGESCSLQKGETQEVLTSGFTYPHGHMGTTGQLVALRHSSEWSDSRHGHAHLRFKELQTPWGLLTTVQQSQERVMKGQR